MELIEITRILSDIDPTSLGSYLYHLRSAWLYATDAHKRLLKPAIENAIDKYPHVFKKEGTE